MGDTTRISRHLVLVTVIENAMDHTTRITQNRPVHPHPLSLKLEVPLRDPHYHLIPYLPDLTFLQLKFRQDTTEVVDRTSTRSRMIKMTIFGRERGRLHLYLDGRIIRKTGGRENTRLCWSSWRRTGTTMLRWMTAREVCWEGV